MRRLPHAGFWKLLGSGTGEGFTPIPNTSVYAILCTWPDLETARSQTRGAAVFSRYIKRAAESWTLFLTPHSARGTWSRKTPFATAPANSDQPLVVLTRATLKTKSLLKFWQQVPGVSKMIGQDANVLFKIGIGEVPWFHQVTFSIWPNEPSMAQFAHHSGPHATAIKAVRSGDWFAEELYARFSITEQSGHWSDRSPLLDFKETTP